MPQTLTNIDALLKSFYRDVLVNLINNDTRLLDIFTKGDAKSLSSDGRNVIYPIITNRNQGVGAIGAGKVLPRAGYQETTDVTVPFRYTYGRIQLEEQAIAQSETNKGAFIKGLTLEMDGLKRDMARIRNRMLFGYGVGILCRVDGSHSSSATTINVRDPGGFTGSVNGARFLQTNQTIAVIRNATPTSAADADIIGTGATISAIAANRASITISAGGFGAVTLNDGDMIVAQPAGSDSNAQTSVNREPMGIQGIVDDGTYLATLHGVSRTTYPQLNSSVITLNGAISIDVMDRALDISDERGNGNIKRIVAHHSIVREYEKILISMKRYVNKDGAMNPDAGFSNNAKDLEFSGIPITKERMAPYGTMFFIDSSSAVRYALKDGEWADRDGTVLLRTPDNIDAYEARFRIFDNFMIDRPDSCARIDGIQGATVDVIGVE